MTRHQQSKRPSPPKPAGPGKANEYLEDLQRIQINLEKVNAIQRKAIESRRLAVATAWRNGATAKEIAQALQISLAKVYTLLPSR